MFSVDVVCSDKFLEMPLSSQALYFQFGMKADDDGFLASPKQITRMANASDDDFKILVAKGYIIPFETGVVVIKDWKVNNYLRKDRYTETRHKKEKAVLEIINDEYVISSELYRNAFEKIPCGIPTCNHVVSQWDTQVRLGKDINNICTPNTVVQVSNDEKIQDQETELNQRSELEAQKEAFEIIYSCYPKKKGKTRAFSHYRNWLKGRKVNGETVRLTNREMHLAVQNYVMQQEEEGVEINFYKNFDTLMGNQLLDYLVEE